MPTELHVIRASDFIRLGAKGDFDLDASKAVLAELAGACRKRGIDRAMLDLRALQPKPTPVFSPTDLAKLINTFREIGFTHRQRLAVLYSADPHHRARMFAFIGTLRGWHVAAFGEFEEAMEWLSEDEAASKDEIAGGEEVKIRRQVDGASRSRTKIRPKSSSRMKS
jgi:hypothetical protein